MQISDKMGSAVTIESFQEKRETILSKFAERFLDGHLAGDPMFNVIVEMLARGDSYEKMFEILLDDRMILLDKVKGLIEKQMPERIVINMPDDASASEFAEKFNGILQVGALAYKVQKY